MAYDPSNNPYVPGDPYAYDLKWVVEQIKSWKDPADSADRAKASENAAAASAEAADLSAQAAANSAGEAKNSENAAKNYADHIADPVSGLVTEWLDDHITQPTTPAIDTSLTVAGAAADAKSAGDRINNIKTDVDNIKDDLYGPANYTEGFYFDNYGNTIADDDFCITDKIPVSPNTGLHFYYGTFSSSIKLIEYDAGDSVVNYYGGINGQAFRSITSSATTSYVRFSFPKGYASKLTNAGETYTYYLAGRYNGTLEEITTGLLQAKSMTGSDRIRVTSNLLTSGTPLEITDFPQNLKKNHGFSFYALFSTFTKIKIGQGYQQYRGKWFEIDNTNIIVKQYEGGETIVGTIAHGLTLYSQINISMIIGDDGYGKCTITTAGGTFTHNFNMGYEVNGNYFVIGDQNLSNVELSAISADFKKPVWMFGDSYFGVSDNRVIGQLKNFGYFNGYLIDGLAGQDSAGAFNELEKCLNFGTPKILVWCLGMNDPSAADYQTIYNTINSICENRNIELILYRIPTVPSLATINQAINSFVMGTNHRYINAFRAVETDASGNWYTGLLDSDGIHPTDLGAQMIASRMIIDIPELMEFI